MTEGVISLICPGPMVTFDGDSLVAIGDTTGSRAPFDPGCNSYFLWKDSVGHLAP
jgi:hypothetical protein